MHLLMAALCLIAGYVQGMAGFGMGMVVISVLPYVMPLTASVAILGVVCIPMNALTSWHWRRHLKLRRVVLPGIFYFLAAMAAISTVQYVPIRILSLAFGLFLLSLSAYFLMTNNKVQFKGGWLMAAVCGFGSGVLDGFFGIGGPLMVLFSAGCERRP